MPIGKGSIASVPENGRSLLTVHHTGSAPEDFDGKVHVLLGFLDGLAAVLRLELGKSLKWISVGSERGWGKIVLKTTVVLFKLRRSCLQPPPSTTSTRPFLGSRTPPPVYRDLHQRVNVERSLVIDLRFPNVPNESGKNDWVSCPHSTP